MTKRREITFVLREHARSIAILVAVLALAAVAAIIMLPVSGGDDRMAGVITDIGPLNADNTSTSQRATVLTTTAQSFIVDVASYPTCRVGSHVFVHRRRTLVGTRTGLWPEGCR